MRSGIVDLPISAHISHIHIHECMYVYKCMYVYIYIYIYPWRFMAEDAQGSLIFRSQHISHTHTCTYTYVRITWRLWRRCSGIIDLPISAHISHIHIHECLSLSLSLSIYISMALYGGRCSRVIDLPTSAHISHIHIHECLFI